MTTRINLQKYEGGWVLDGHGAWKVFNAETAEMCIAEAIRRGHRVDHFGSRVNEYSPANGFVVTDRGGGMSLSDIGFAIHA